MAEKTYYHYTKEKYIWDILKNKRLKVGKYDLGVFVCDSFEDLVKFKRIAEIKQKAISEYTKTKLKDGDRIVGIEFTADESLFEESFDHSPELMKARAFVSDMEVPIKNIQVFNFVKK